MLITHDRPVTPWLHALRTGWRGLVVAGPPLLLTAWYLSIAAGGDSLAVDFENNFWPAGHHVLNAFTRRQN